jgi:peptidoglycan biosynthesis protein MviN/MurJ (putative lipid II flippase)
MYGAVNARTILILSLCLPLLYLNNFLWTLHFAHGRLRWILTAFAAGFVLNVSGDLVLIPLYGNEGAAGAFLGAILLQTLLYHRHIAEVPPGRTWLNLGVCAVCAGMSAWGATSLFKGVWAPLAGATLFYGVGLVLTGRIGRGEIQYVKLNLS